MNINKPLNLLNDRFIKVIAHKKPELIKMLILRILDIDSKDSAMKYLSTVIPLTNINEYLKTVDFNILINDNIIVNLEINNSEFKLVKERNYIYLAKLINYVLKKGNKSNCLKDYEVYQININGNSKDNKYGYRVIKNIYKDTYEEYLKNVQIIEINLEYYKNLLYTEDKKELLYKSLLSKSIEELDNNLKRCVSEKLKKEIIEEVESIMEEPDIVFTEEEAEGLDRMVMQTIEADIQERIKEASDEAKSKATRESKLLIAKKLLLKKIPIEIIKDVTGLSLKTIKNIVL